MNDNDIYLMIKTLKKLLKRENVKYSDIAAILDLSEVSIKRMLSKHDLTLSRLASICSMINISIIELAEITKKETEDKNFFLTLEQENVFAKKPLFFNFFARLYRGEELNSVTKALGLKRELVFSFLRELEKLSLLELYPQNKYKFIVSGRLRWSLEGPLFNKVLKKQNQDFLEAVYKNVRKEDCCFQSSQIQLTKHSKTLMVNEINELGRKYRDLSYQEERLARKKDLVDVRWLFAFLPYQASWKEN